MAKACVVYILANKNNAVLYTGVTSNLEVRLQDHKSNHKPSSFTSRYRVHKLVYFEEFEDISDAIIREKQIKAGSRKKKDELVESINPEWRDLAFDYWGSDEPQ